MAKTGRDVEGQASHLCDRPACFNEQHIVDETPKENNSRKGCPGDQVCQDHGHLILPCLHSPKCLRLPRADLSCCLSVLEASEPAGVSQPLPVAGQSSQDAVGEQQVEADEGGLPVTPAHNLESSDYGSLPDISEPPPENAQESSYGDFPSDFLPVL